MTQSDLNRAVARATGESLTTIAEMGFVPLVRVPSGGDPEDLCPDWDDLGHERLVNVFTRRQPRTALP